MPDTPTSGQRVYEAFWPGGGGPWTLLPAYERASWPAAAPAVRAREKEEHHNT